MTDKQTGWIKGMNNILPDFELPSDTLRNAVNVDILDTGGVRRRKGSTRVLAGTGVHSFWSNNVLALFVEDGDLKRLDDDFTAALVRAGVGGGVMQYEEIDGVIYYTNNVVCGKVVDGEHREWGVEAPTTPPAMVAGAGFLPAGIYQAICTFVNDLGEESSCARSNVKTLLSDGGLTLTLPQPASPEVSFVRVYLTAPNGDVLYHVDDVAVGTLSLSIDAPPQYGPACRTQFFVRAMPGETLTYYRGRIYVVQGSLVWCTEPYNFGLVDPRSGFMPFGVDVTMLAAVVDGLFIACGKTYFLSGSGPQDFERTDVFPFGAARYSNTRNLRSNDVLWYSERGIVIGSDGGKASLTQERNVIPGAHTRGATIVSESNSLNQIVSVVSGSPGISNLAAVDYMDAEIVRAEG